MVVLLRIEVNRFSGRMERETKSTASTVSEVLRSSHKKNDGLKARAKDSSCEFEATKIR
jgi:hypothetical protein